MEYREDLLTLPWLCIFCFFGQLVANCWFDGSTNLLEKIIYYKILADGSCNYNNSTHWWPQIATLENHVDVWRQQLASLLRFQKNNKIIKKRNLLHCFNSDLNLTTTDIYTHTTLFLFTDIFTYMVCVFLNFLSIFSSLCTFSIRNFFWLYLSITNNNMWFI